LAAQPTDPKRLEAELQELRDAQYRTLRLVDQLNAEIEALRVSQLKLKKSYRNLDERLSNTSRLAESIEQSRIWQSLKAAAAFALSWQARLSGQPPPPPTTAPAGFKMSGPVKPGRRRTGQASSARATASRHSAGRNSVEAWKSALLSVLRTSPIPAAATPRVSIITPAYNTKPEWFAEVAISVLEQSCPDWEWIVVDDASRDRAFHALFDVLQSHPRIRILRLPENRNISGATNAGLEAAQGEFVAFLDHDDLLHNEAVARSLAALDQGLDAVYTDSDKVDAFGLRTEPFHKPAWSPDYFRGVMYVGHLLTLRTELARRAGGFDSRFDRIQDYEFFLRVSEQTQRIGHIPEVLYHWRTVPGSIASEESAKGDIQNLQVAAVSQHLARLALPALAEPGPQAHRVRVKPALRDYPKISIVIPTKDAPDVLETCLKSLFERSTYTRFEVVLCDNDTTDARARNLFTRFPVVVQPVPGRFNYSRANNLGVAASSGEYLVFLNNDTELVTPDWLEEMLLYAAQPGVGAVGAKLLYPDRTLQHAGVILGMRGTADHGMRFAPEDADGYFGSLSVAREVSAVTAACLMVRRSSFDAARGFNEHYFTAYQDVDLCLTLRRQGLRNIFQPNAVLLHYESRTRGKYYDHVDRHLLLDRFHPEIDAGDPYYNPNFDLDSGDYRLL
jgi:GT2 family glycosyltransferase